MVIKIKCPSCNKNIDIEIDNKFQVVSAFVNEQQLLSCKQVVNEVLKQLGIEFG